MHIPYILFQIKPTFLCAIKFNWKICADKMWQSPAFGQSYFFKMSLNFYDFVFFLSLFKFHISETVIFMRFSDVWP